MKEGGGGSVHPVQPWGWRVVAGCGRLGLGLFWGLWVVWAGCWGGAADLLGAPKVEAVLDEGDFRVDRIVEVERWPQGPFVSLRLRIHNRSPEEQTLWISGGVNHSTGGAREVGTSETLLRVAPGVSTREVYLPGPFLKGFGHYPQFEIRAGGSHVTLRVQQGSGAGDTAPFWVMTQEPELVSAELLREMKGRKSRVLPGTRLAGGGLGVGSFSDLGGVCSAMQGMPADPRFWANLGGLWLKASDWNALGLPVRQMIRDWVRAGGWLYWTPDGVQGPGDGWEGLRTLGLGRIEEVKAPGADTSRLVGDALVELDRNPFPGREEDYRGWRSGVVSEFQVHSTALILFLAVFSLVAVPLNLKWFAPVSRRHRLFVTIPVITVGAVGGLLVAILGLEGTGGVGIRNGLLLLSPGETRAYLYQEQLSRTAMLASGAFEVPETAVFCMVHASKLAHRGYLRRGTELTGSWFASRSVQGQVAQHWRPSRESVELRSGDGPRLVSTVGEGLGPVYYADRDGGYWRTEGLMPGVVTELKAVSEAEFAQWCDRFFDEPSSNLRARLAEARQRKGWFFGMAQGKGGWIPTASRVEWKRDQLLVLGPVEPEGKR